MSMPTEELTPYQRVQARLGRVSPEPELTEQVKQLPALRKSPKPTPMQQVQQLVKTDQQERQKLRAAFPDDDMGEFLFQRTRKAQVANRQARIREQNRQQVAQQLQLNHEFESHVSANRESILKEGKMPEFMGTTEVTPEMRMMAADSIVNEMIDDKDFQSSAPQRIRRYSRWVPVLKMMEGAAADAHATKASIAIAKGEGTQKDYVALSLYLREADDKRKQGMLADVRDVVQDMPGFMASLVFSGGSYALGKKATEKAIKKTVSKKIRDSAAGKLGTGLAGGLVGTGTRLGSPVTYGVTGRKVQQEYAAGVMPQGTDEEGNFKFAQQDGLFMESLAKGVGSTYIEMLTEKAGAAVGTQVFRNTVVKPVLGKWAKANGKTMDDAWAKVAKEGGYDGIFAELGEERLGEVLHGVTGLSEDYGVTGKALSGDLEGAARDLTVEAAAFGIIPGAQAVGRKGTAIRQRKRLNRAKEMMDKGFISKEDTQELAEKFGVQLSADNLKNRETRKAAVQQIIQQDEQELQDAETIPSTETKVREGESGPDLRGEGKREIPAEPAGEVAAAQEVPVAESPPPSGDIDAAYVEGLPDDVIGFFFIENEFASNQPNPEQWVADEYNQWVADGKKGPGAIWRRIDAHLAKQREETPAPIPKPEAEPTPEAIDAAIEAEQAEEAEPEVTPDQIEADMRKMMEERKQAKAEAAKAEEPAAPPVQPETPAPPRKLTAHRVRLPDGREGIAGGISKGQRKVKLEDGTTILANDPDLQDLGKKKAKPVSEVKRKVQEAAESPPIEAAPESAKPVTPKAEAPAPGTHYVMSQEEKADRLEALKENKKNLPINLMGPKGKYGRPRFTPEEMLEKEEKALAKYPVGTKLKIEGYPHPFTVQPDGKLMEVTGRNMGDNAGAVLWRYMAGEATSDGRGVRKEDAITVVSESTPIPKSAGRKDQAPTESAAPVSKPKSTGKKAETKAVKEKAPVKPDVTQRRLNELQTIPARSESHYLTKFTKKKPGAKLTKTEQSVMDSVGDGIDIGYVSKALAYAEPLRTFTKPQRKALLTLLHKGDLRIEDRGNKEWIVPSQQSEQASSEEAEFEKAWERARGVLSRDVDLALDKQINRYSDQARKDEGGRGIAVGAENINYRWAADAVREFRNRVRKGMDPVQAAEEVKAITRGWIEKHNARRPKDISWQRSAESADSYIDTAMRTVAQAVPKRSEAAATKKEAGIQKAKDAAKRFIEDKQQKFAGKPMTHKEKLSAVLDIVEGLSEWGVNGFKEYVYKAVELLGEARARDLAGYLEKGWKLADKPDVGSVTAILDERQAEEVAEPVSEETPEPEETPVPLDGDDLTGIKKAVVNDLRAMVGLPEMEGSTPQTVEEWAEHARATLANDPEAGIRLVNNLAANPRPITEREAMLLQFRYRQLANELKPAVDELTAAAKTDDSARKAAARTEVIRRRSAMSEFEQIIHPSKETWGRTGVALQQLLRRDFSLDAILRRGQESNHGNPLEANQIAELTEMAKKLEELQEKFDAERKHKEELQRELASKEQHEKVVKETKRNRVRAKSERRKAAEKKVDDAWAAYRKDASGLAPGGLGSVKLLPHAVKIAKAYLDLNVVRVQEFLSFAKKNAGDAYDEDLFRQAWSQAKQEAAADADVNMEDLAWLTREARAIQRSLVESGLTEREAVIDAVHEEMQSFLPNFTRLQTMDALSAYGQFQQPSQDEISTIIREMNAEILKLDQIDRMEAAIARAEELRGEDMSEEEIGNQLVKENLLVKATGFVRDKPHEVLRNLTKEYNELKKQIPASSEGRAGRLQTATDAIVRGLKNRIADLNYEIAHKERIVRNRKDTPENDEIRALRAERDELLKIHRSIPELKPERKKRTTDQQLDAIFKAGERAIEKLEEQLKALDVAPESKQSLSTPAIEAQRAYKAQLRAELNALRAEMMPELAEQRARKAYEASLLKRIAQYQQTLASGDFSPQSAKEPRKLSPRELKLKRDMEDVRHEVLEKFAEYHLANLHGIAWGLDKAAEIAHLSRALMTSFDASALLRQGGVVALSHPKIAQEAFTSTFAAMAHTFDKDKALAFRDGVSKETLQEFIKTIDTRQAEFDFMHKITSGADGEFRLQAGLALPSTDEAITRQEEVFQGRWGKHIPGIAFSGRLYTMTLNKLRADLFDLMVQNLGRNGEVSLAEAKIIANFVNVATGRADFAKWAEAVGMGYQQKLNNIAAVLNTVFFVPRYVASRFQYLAMPFYLPFQGGVKSNWRVKRAIYKEYGRTVGGVATVLGAVHLLAYLFWDDDDEDKPTVEWDMNSADFWKVKMGDTRLDFMAGLSQVMVLSQRMAPEWLGGGKVKSSVSGEIREFGEGFNPQTRATLAGRFIRTKMAPVPGAVWTMFAGWENVVGGKETPISLATGLLVPLSLRDIFETWKAQGIPKGTAMGALALLGVGMNTYGPKTEYAYGTPEDRKEQFEKDLKKMQWDTESLPYSEYLTEEQKGRFEKAIHEKRGRVISFARPPQELKRSAYGSDELYEEAVTKQQEDQQKDLDKFQEMLETQNITYEQAMQLLLDYHRRDYKGLPLVELDDGDLRDTYREALVFVDETFGKEKGDGIDWWREHGLASAKEIIRMKARKKRGLR